MMVERDFSSVKTIIVKIGTNLLTEQEGKLDLTYLKNVVEQVTAIKKKGFNVLIVSSGAIGAGMGELGIKERITDLELMQATAAVGQAILMEHYKRTFGEMGQKVAQILVTYDTFKEETTYSNLKHTLKKLLSLGVIPILNENDVIATDEIQNSFGDNDRMAALVTGKLGAELLLVLSNVEGLYDADPNTNKEFSLIKTVDKITDEMLESAESKSSLGRGGMKSKLCAAKLAMNCGAIMIIADGKEEKVIERLVDGEDIGTLFLPSKNSSNPDFC